VTRQRRPARRSIRFGADDGADPDIDAVEVGDADRLADGSHPGKKPQKKGRPNGRP